jgi:Flp pilus assembly protein CpaB
MKKPGTILLMAVVLGALVSAWVYNLIRAREREVEAGPRAAAGETIELVVAAAEIPIGDAHRPLAGADDPLAVDAEPEGAVKRTETCRPDRPRHDREEPSVRGMDSWPRASACCPC